MGDDVCVALSFQDYYTIKFGSQPKDLDEDLLKGIVGGGKKDEHEVQVVGELHLELTVHDEDVHEEIALEPSCESSCCLLKHTWTRVSLLTAVCVPKGNL